VCLAAYSAAGIGGSRPLETGIEAWKLAKGLYIIPIVMAYRPLLGMGKDYSLFHWQVGYTMLVTTLGLVAFASCLERYFLRSATWLETGLFLLAAAGLFWPTYWSDVAGFASLVAVVGLQKFLHPRQSAVAVSGS
jgi:TRAP-type uncharacterized transport system fused permease subunit